jgi:hypothetical protein
MFMSVPENYGSGCYDGDGGRGDEDKANNLAGDMDGVLDHAASTGLPPLSM